MPASRQTIIAVTGTKGKTSLVRQLDAVLSGIYESIVRVESSGAYYNDELRFSEADSREIWGYASTNAPGRFMTLHGQNSGLSILECTLFNAYTHLAYKAHDIGIFTNVFEDHIGAFPAIQASQDIAEMKSFIFKKIKPTGYAIYNADDKLVTAELAKAPQTATKIAVSVHDGGSDADYRCVAEDRLIVVKDRAGVVKLQVDMTTLSWLQMTHQPSLYLALFTVATLFALLAGEPLQRALKALTNYQFAEHGGRMVTLLLPNGATVILDNAHEKVSLLAVAEHARSLAGPSGKVYGVIRLAPSRTEALITDTAQVIAPAYDSFYVYDKVDGHYRQASRVKGYKDKRETVGKTAEQLSQALRKAGAAAVQMIIREDEAIQAAVKNSGKGDVIVYIVGDDPVRSRQFLQTGIGENS